MRAASIEILAVSPSRISPTITTSGSERRIERSAAANVSPARWLICTWLMPGSRYSTGSSTVMMLISGRLICARHAKSVVDLPEPVGPVTSSAPVGRLTMSASSSRISSDIPSSLERRRLLRLVEQTHDDRLALDRRQRRDADVEHAAGGGSVQRDAAVLRLTALGDVELREHLQARRHAGRIRFGMRCISCSTPSMRKRTTSASSCGSKWMSEAPSSAAWKMHRVDEPDERGVGDAVVGLEVVDRPRPRRSWISSRAPGGRRRPRTRGRACAARRGCRRASRRRARADSASRAAARRCRAGSPGRRRRRAAPRPRTRTGSRRRARARAAERASTASGRRRSSARSTSGSRCRAARMRAMPSLEATPSSTSAPASEPVCWARPRASASLSAGTSFVAASRSTTSSTASLMLVPGRERHAGAHRLEARGPERRGVGCSRSYGSERWETSRSIPRTSYRQGRVEGLGPDHSPGRGPCL